jgi:hypothetical protein
VSPPGAGVEPELQRLPRRPRWRGARWRFWLRVALLGPPTAALAWMLGHSAWLWILAVLGTRIEARIVEREATASSFGMTLEYPRRRWSGAEYAVREVVPLTAAEYGGMVRVQRLPGLRLGRGTLQVVHIEKYGEPLEAMTMALELALLVVPLVGGAFYLMWGALAREAWLVTWGRPVRGVVRGRRQRGKRFPRYAVSYEYREMTERGASATLRGTARVTRALYEASAPGQPLTVLHALWNPRWHVAYPFARLGARR